MKLRTDKLGFDATGVRDALDALVVGREAQGVFRERGGLVFNLEHALIHPDRHLRTGEAVFPKEMPVLESDTTMPVELAGELCRTQDTREHLLRVGSAQYPTQHCLRAVPPILSLLMGQMMFEIVIGPPFPMGLLQLCPRAGIGKIVVRKPF